MRHLKKETCESSLTYQNNISTFFSLSFPFSLSHILSLHPQICCLSPVMPYLTPSRQSSAKKSSPSNEHFSKIDDANCVPSKGGKKKLNVEARLTNSTSRRSPSPSKSGHSPQKNKKKRTHASSRVSVDCSYQQPTVSSRTRALSPYTHRKMCQLSEDTRQRLSHLQLGPHYFRKETESQPPFLVGNIRDIHPN